MIDKWLYELKLLWGDVTPRAKMACGVIIIIALLVL